MFFKSCVEVSVGSSYIKFVAVGACQFGKNLSIKKNEEFVVNFDMHMRIVRSEVLWSAT